MINQIRVFWPRIRGEKRLNFNWPGIIKHDSVVHISISEAKRSTRRTVFGQFTYDRWLGDARMTVNNISPHEDGVEFRITVDWNAPLNVMLDITVFDPPSLIWDVELKTPVHVSLFRSVRVNQFIEDKLGQVGMAELKKLTESKFQDSDQISVSANEITPARKSRAKSPKKEG